MKTHSLERVLRDQRGTLGVLTVGDKKFYTLERPWINNIPFISCIPLGEYVAQIVVSPTKGKVYQLRSVSNRTYVQIHKGNYIRHSLGCILPGLEFRKTEGQELAVFKSRIALAQLHEALKGIPRFRIRIHD